jgi:proteasome accessory factor B
VQRVGPPGGYEVPADLDTADLVLPPPEPADGREALVRVRPGRAVLLRQRAAPAPEGEAEGWDAVRVVVGDVHELAHELAGYGPDVLVVEPADLREEVVRVLSQALAAATAAAPREPAPAAVGGPA